VSQLNSNSPGAGRHQTRNKGSKSLADAGSCNTTRLPILMPIACQVFVFGYQMEIEIGKDND
jgi:hypothetical protein